MSASAAGAQANSAAAIAPAIPKGISLDFMRSSSLFGSGHYATVPGTGRQSQSLDQVGPVDHVAGVAEVAHLEQAVLRPVEQDEIERRAAGIVGIVGQHPPPAPHQAPPQPP